MNYGSNEEPDFLPHFDLKFVDHSMHFYHLPKMYLGYFGKVPSVYKVPDLDVEQFSREFHLQFRSEILGQHFRRFSDKEDWENEYIYVLKKKILVEQDRDEVAFYFRDERCELLQQLLSFTERFKKEKPDMAQIQLITVVNGELDNKAIDFKKPELDFSKVYNDDFAAFHQKIFSILKEKDKSGLHLLYGKPGTGKSTYIKYLCGQVKKKLIFLSGQMAQNLDNVAMTRYLINNANSVLVIEDAEELIVSRDQKRNSNLAMILNITDGILGESLGIQIIATFNTDVQNIDPALKRKGRLKSAYEFKALPASKAAQLLKEEGIDIQVQEEMTLAEIYNFNEEEQYRGGERKAVGFR